MPAGASLDRARGRSRWRSWRASPCSSASAGSGTRAALEAALERAGRRSGRAAGRRRDGLEPGREAGREGGDGHHHHLAPRGGGGVPCRHGSSALQVEGPRHHPRVPRGDPQGPDALAGGGGVPDLSRGESRLGARRRPSALALAGDRRSLSAARSPSKLPIGLVRTGSYHDGQSHQQGGYSHEASRVLEHGHWARRPRWRRDGPGAAAPSRRASADAHAVAGLRGGHAREILNPNGAGARVGAAAAHRGHRLLQEPRPDAGPATPRSAASSATTSTARASSMAEWEAGEAAPVVEVTTRFATRDRAVDFSRPTDAREDRRVLARYIESTRLMPTDGIVQKTAREITKGQKSDLDKARALYEWIVDNTFRDPKVRGCGVGDIRAMLESGNLSGKCADLNALYVGLARSVGIPVARRLRRAGGRLGGVQEPRQERRHHAGRSTAGPSPIWPASAGCRWIPPTSGRWSSRSGAACRSPTRPCSGPRQAVRPVGDELAGLQLRPRRQAAGLHRRRAWASSCIPRPR